MTDTLSSGAPASSRRRSRQSSPEREPPATPHPPSVPLFEIEGFDADFYLRTYPDVREAKVDPLIHYMNAGRRELRYPNEAKLLEELHLVEQSGLFDHAYYRSQHQLQSDPVRHFLLTGRAPRLRPNETFDRVFFLQYYSRSLRSEENPFVFYCRHRDMPWCFQNAEEARAQVEIISGSGLFSPDYWRINGEPDLGRDAALYYLTEGARLLHDPSLDFTTAAYLYEYPDIVAAGVNPVIHYEQAGRNESRRTFGRSNAQLSPGGREFDPRKPTILIASHEASRTGAPILVLNLLRHLEQFNLVCLLMGGGPLLEDYKPLCCAWALAGPRPGLLEPTLRLITDRFDISCALLNTIVCTGAIEPLLRRDIPIVTLVHDFAQYTRPLGVQSKAMLLSDAIVYPSPLVRDAALEEVQRLTGLHTPPSNCRILPQGRCLTPPRPARDEPTDIAREIDVPADGPRPLVVMGSGSVTYRKGVDLFIEAARVMRHDLGQDCRFVWVGAGYQPDTDQGYSVYLEDQVRKSGLEDIVRFVGEHESLDPWADAADVFFVASRLDPYPNVVFDVIGRGLPVVCFEGATGVADLAADYPAWVRAAPYMDTYAAVALMQSLADDRREGRLELPPGLAELLSFERYAGHVAEMVRTAAHRAQVTRPIRLAAAKDDSFDSERFSRSIPAWLLSPLGRTGPTQEALALAACKLAANDAPLAVFRKGKLSGRTAVRWSGSGGRSPADHRAVDPRSGGRAQLQGGVLARVEHPGELRRLADYVFALKAMETAVVISAGLRERDLQPLRSLLAPGAVTLVRPGPGGSLADTAAIEALIRGKDLIHVLRLTSSRTGEPAAARLAPELTLAAGALLKRDSGVGLVLAQSDEGDLPPGRPVTGAPTASPPRRLIDLQQCWAAARPDVALGLARELAAEQGRSEAVPLWGESFWTFSEGPQANWALIESIVGQRHGYDLTQGRIEFERPLID